MLLDVCEMYNNNISNGFQLSKRTRVHARNGCVQRAITPKAGKQELRFICSASRLIVLYICMNFVKI